MYYNRILRVWVIDQVDLFVLSLLIGSISASCLKEYLSEKRSMERLKKSIIKKSPVKPGVISPLFSSPENRERYRLTIDKESLKEFLLTKRGGDILDWEVTDGQIQLAEKVPNIIERLAIYLKKRELKGLLKIVFKNGRLVLELLLYHCKIDISYQILEGVPIQVMVITMTTGGIVGFVSAWYSVAAAISIPPLAAGFLLLRFLGQQVRNHKELARFKQMLNETLKDPKIQERVRALFVENEIPGITDIKMKPWDLDKTPLPEFSFEPDQTLEEFLKARMKEELGLVENPSPQQISKILKTRNNPSKGKGKVVYFKDLINRIADDAEDILDVQVVKEAQQAIREKIE